MKHRVLEIDPTISANDYDDISGIKALNDLLRDIDTDYSRFIYNEI
ncbi:MAG: hypothetical protein ACFFFH_09115 [Candidatus Thorarchaeota archaeon]